jgi:sugar phosphate permease
MTADDDDENKGLVTETDAGEESQTKREMWQILASLALMSFLGYLTRMNLAVATVPMSLELGWTAGDKTLLLLSFFLGNASSQFLGASLVAKFGGRRAMGYSALVWTMITLLVPSLAHHSVFALASGRALLGMSQGVILPAYSYLIRYHVSPEYFSRAVAIGNMGLLVGSVFAFVSVPFFTRWESAFYLHGALGPGLVGLWFYFIPESSPRVSKDDVASPPVVVMSYWAMLRIPVVFAVCLSQFTDNLCDYAVRCLCVDPPTLG